MELEKYLSVDEMMQSIQDEPEKWLITDNYAIFFGKQYFAQDASKKAFPRLVDTAKIVIYFNLYRGSAQLEKPDGPWYKGSDLRKIINTIKLYKYNRYKKELGIKDEVKIVVKEVVKNPNEIKKLF